VRLKNHTRPKARRAVSVACSTSGLVDVLTTGPGCAMSAGITTHDVLPARGPARTRPATSGGAEIHWPWAECEVGAAAGVSGVLV